MGAFCAALTNVPHTLRLPNFSGRPAIYVNCTLLGELGIMLKIECMDTAGTSLRLYPETSTRQWIEYGLIYKLNGGLAARCVRNQALTPDPYNLYRNICFIRQSCFPNHRF